MKGILFALRMLARDWRHGELRTLLIALVIAVTCISSVGFFGDRVQRAMGQQASQFLGGDIVVTGTIEPSNEWYLRANEQGIQSARSVSFMSMLSRNDQLQLATVRAVDNHYPLRGVLRVSPGAVRSARRLLRQY